MLDAPEQALPPQWGLWTPGASTGPPSRPAPGRGNQPALNAEHEAFHSGQVFVKQSVPQEGSVLLKRDWPPADSPLVAQADLRRVEKAAANAAKSREELRAAIKLARAAGETLGDIGRASGLSRQRIAQILRSTR